VVRASSGCMRRRRFRRPLRVIIDWCLRIAIGPISEFTSLTRSFLSMTGSESRRSPGIFCSASTKLSTWSTRTQVPRAPPRYLPWRDSHWLRPSIRRRAAGNPELCDGGKSTYLTNRVSRPAWTGGVGATSKEHREASFDGADGVVDQKILRTTTPSARAEVASRFFLIAQPPLLSRRGDKLSGANP